VSAQQPVHTTRFRCRARESRSSPALPPSPEFLQRRHHPRRAKQKSPTYHPAMDRSLPLEGPRTHHRSIRYVFRFRHQPASIAVQGPRKHGRKFRPPRCYRASSRSSTSVALAITQPQIHRKLTSYTYLPSNLPESPPPCSQESAVIKNRCKERRRKKKTTTEVEENLRRI
jgi:hypothetical protein